VDVVIGTKEWKELKKAGAVISGQSIEHAEEVLLFMAEIYHKVAPGGLVCIIAPSAGQPHLPYASPNPTEVWGGTWNGHWPIDRMTFAVEAAGLDVIRCSINKDSEWQDCVCVAMKHYDSK
jgi:hypothetical protein